MRLISTAICGLLLLVATSHARPQASSSTDSAQKPASSSQQNGGVSVQGVVSDATGAVVVGAAVTVQTASGAIKNAVSDEAGKFKITGLAEGPTELRVKAPGFAEFKSEGFNAIGGENVFDVQLQPAAASTNVNVEGQRVTQIETENAEVSGTITQKEIVSYGLNGRNFSTLIALAPGVSNQTGQDEAKVGVVGSAKYSVNGGRTEYNTFDVDGNDVLNTDIAASHGQSTLLVYPSIDSIQELKVLTSNYGALYGRSASGTVVVETKTGGAQFHGNAYEFLRNEAFNARNYFDVSNKAPLYRRNDFGITLGGPFFIPHVFNTKKDKTFFFWSEEWRKEKSPFEFNQAVPSDAQRGFNLVTQTYSGIADFNDVCPIPPAGSIVVFSLTKFPDCPGKGTSTRRQTFVDNRFVIDPTAAAILQSGLIPRANSTSGCNSSIDSCYVATVSPITDWREELVKLDHNFTPNMRLSVSGIHDHWVTETSTPQWENQPNSFPTVMNSFLGPGWAGQAHLTSVISPTFLNDFSVGFTVHRVKLFDIPGPGANLSRSGLDALQFPMGFLLNNGFGGKIPGLVIGGNNTAYGGAGFTVDTSFEPWYHGRGTASINDGLSKVWGKHTLQFGFQFVNAIRHEVNAANGANSGNVQGVLTYRNTGSYLTTGNAFADFLYGGQTTPDPTVGNILSYQQDSSQLTYKVHYWILEPYLQDDWRVNPRVVLNLGLRLSLFQNWQPEGRAIYNWQTSAYNPNVIAQSNTSINALRGYLQDSAALTPIPFDTVNLNPILTNGLVQCGRKGVPFSCQTSHVFNPAPRIGFAWDPTGKGTTSVRAGYGVFFEHGTGSEANVGSLMGNPPQILSLQEDYPGSPYDIGFYNANRQTAVPAAYPLNVVSIPNRTTWPYVQQWSLGVQREVTKDTTASISYVGSKGTHLAVAMQLNQLKPVSGANNPLGLHDPITAAFCAGNQVTTSNPFDPVGYFELANGTLLHYSDNPSAVLALIAACDGSPATSGHPAISFDLNVLRPYQGIGNITAIENVASSVYHSMQITLRRNHGPLDLGMSYTYGHSIDSASDRYESNFVDAFDLRANRASSDFDQRHLLNVSYVYQLPLLRAVEWLHTYVNCSSGQDCESVVTPYRGPARITRALLGGWAMSGIGIYQSGTPFSVVNGASNTGISVLDNAGLALGLSADSYPDIMNGNDCNLSKSTQHTFGPLLHNPCMFVAPRGLTQGNAGRNYLNNPGRTNVDVALLRSFKMPHEMDLEFRAEVFNVLNHTQFIIYDPNKGNTASNTISCYGDSSTNYSAGAPGCLAGNGFLHPVEAHRPRTVQFGLKLQF